MGEIDSYYGETIADLTKSIDDVRILARDSVNAKEKELQQFSMNENKKLTDMVYESINDIMMEK